MTAGRKKIDKRGKGRPTASQSGVGREALISAARDLLQELPPAQVTSTAIARRANADPALVRYYFGNRENLLFEVAKQIGAEANRPPPDEGDPVELLADMVHNTFRFTRSAKHMQRLMIEELDSASSAEVREKMREWNRQPLSNYAKLQELDGEGKLVSTLTATDAHAYLASDIVSGGMKPKLEAALGALAAGVAVIGIGSGVGSVMGSETGGTYLVAA